MSKELIPVETLVSEGQVHASVTKSSSAKISHGEYWGPLGSWDKIPYSVEVFTSVTLQCDQTGEAIQRAENMAEDISVGAVKDHIGRLLLAHSDDIRSRLFLHIFEDEDV
jgi:hypothetical protein